MRKATSSQDIHRAIALNVLDLGRVEALFRSRAGPYERPSPQCVRRTSASASLRQRVRRSS